MYLSDNDSSKRNHCVSYPADGTRVRDSVRIYTCDSGPQRVSLSASLHYVQAYIHTCNSSFASFLSFTKHLLAMPTPTMPMREEPTVYHGQTRCQWPQYRCGNHADQFNVPYYRDHPTHGPQLTDSRLDLCSDREYSMWHGMTSLPGSNL
jgi:hypothetical protein